MQAHFRSVLRRGRLIGCVYLDGSVDSWAHFPHGGSFDGSSSASAIEASLVSIFAGHSGSSVAGFYNGCDDPTYSDGESSQRKFFLHRKENDFGRVPDRNVLSRECQHSRSFVHSEGRDIVTPRMAYVHEVTVGLYPEVARIATTGPIMPGVQNPAIRIDVEHDDRVVKPIRAIQQITVIGYMDLRRVVGSGIAGRQAGRGLPFQVRRPDAGS